MRVEIEERRVLGGEPREDQRECRVLEHVREVSGMESMTIIHWPHFLTRRAASIKRSGVDVDRGAPI
jgi:hypothetical protein